MLQRNSYLENVPYCFFLYFSAVDQIVRRGSGMYLEKLGLEYLQKRASHPGPNWLTIIILNGTVVPKSVVSVVQSHVLDFLEPSLVAFRQDLTLPS